MYGINWQNIFVLLSDAPKITYPLENQSVVTGGISSFVCVVTGNPVPQIEWRKNGKEISSSRHMVIPMLQGSVLRIEPVRIDRDEAEYECIANNGVGSPASSTATLTIYGGESGLGVHLLIVNFPFQWMWL